MSKLNPGNIIFVKKQLSKTKLFNVGVYNTTEEWATPDKIIIAPFSKIIIHEAKIMGPSGEKNPNEINLVKVINEGNKEKIIENFNYIFTIEIEKTFFQPINPINQECDCDCKQKIPIEVKEHFAFDINTKNLHGKDWIWSLIILIILIFLLLGGVWFYNKR